MGCCAAPPYTRRCRRTAPRRQPFLSALGVPGSPDALNESTVAPQRRHHPSRSPIRHILRHLARGPPQPARLRSRGDSRVARRPGRVHKGSAANALTSLGNGPSGTSCTMFGLSMPRHPPSLRAPTSSFSSAGALRGNASPVRRAFQGRFDHPAIVDAIPPAPANHPALDVRRRLGRTQVLRRPRLRRMLEKKKPRHAAGTARGGRGCELRRRAERIDRRPAEFAAARLARTAGRPRRAVARRIGRLPRHNKPARTAPRRSLPSVGIGHGHSPGGTDRERAISWAVAASSWVAHSAGRCRVLPGAKSCPLLRRRSEPSACSPDFLQHHPAKRVATVALKGCPRYPAAAVAVLEGSPPPPPLGRRSQVFRSASASHGANRPTFPRLTAADRPPDFVASGGASRPDRLGSIRAGSGPLPTWNYPRSAVLPAPAIRLARRLRRRRPPKNRRGSPAPSRRGGAHSRSGSSSRSARIQKFSTCRRPNATTSASRSSRSRPTASALDTGLKNR